MALHEKQLVVDDAFHSQNFQGFSLPSDRESVFTQPVLVTFDISKTPTKHQRQRQRIN